jgi:hypothetical protein
LQHAAGNLGSVAERDETPVGEDQLNVNSIMSSPMFPRTPKTALRPKPSREEMHPSMAHQSTTKKPDSGLRLGFADIKGNGENQPSGVSQKSPSKTGISASFDFRFARPAPDLGEDAQRLMDELREEAMKIKARLAIERQEKRQAEEEAQRRAGQGNSVNGRKIAQPKGKAGRYSDVHMAEFKKMDSIAGHASAYRAQPGRFAPATTSLKRTQSKANLDSREESSSSNLQKSHKTEVSERLENTAPAKRARKAIADDTSSARPVSRSGVPVPSTPKQARSSAFLDTISTPTQASLARNASVKGATTQIPTLSKSPSKPNLMSGTRVKLTKSATTNNVTTLPKSMLKSNLKSPGRFERVRSILRHVSPSHRKPAAVQSSSPSLSRSPSKPNFEKALPSVPTTPVAVSKTAKHVNFTPDTTQNTSASAFHNSPSPVKSGIPRSSSKASIAVKSASGSDETRHAYPSVKAKDSVGTDRPQIEYPSLSGVRPLPPTPKAAPAHLPPSVPSTFTFRSDHTIDFGASPKSFGASPGQASLRQVRQSVMPGSFPGSNKENSEPLPSVPHGMLNKKRRRTDSDETEEDADRSPKKQKAEVAEGAMLVAPRLIATPKSKINSATPSPKKGILSMSRLNMLARPKMRQ